MNKKETSNPVDIKKYLPHRAPMLMVDLILEMDDEQVETVFEIKLGNIFLENGFFTESGLVENMAQTCSSVVAKDYFIDENYNDKEGVDVVGFISGIKTLKIHALPEVGNVIYTKALLVSKFITDSYSLCTMKCQTFRGDELLLEGEITLFIQENKS
ncbi:MAG TPA: ABC transporter permease [Flavobacterium sp.]|uniref:ABC transporter permease n=1 Tax=Flavobacterium sp. TaxID=239 RepID=UPI002DBAA030|nr:ABC transporter permease [Flavobacterium sp.]HEU4790668.1 ABC transporter permease [Flavobacterium sp.]